MVSNSTSQSYILETSKIVFFLTTLSHLRETECKPSYEDFYGVIVTPKLIIRITFIYRLPIIERGYKYNAISTVTNKTFSSHSAEGKHTWSS